MSHQATYQNSPRSDSVQAGLEFQDYVADVLRNQMAMIVQNYSSKRFQYERGENPQGCEIKLDTRCAGPQSGNNTPTHRLSIEVAEKTAIAKEWVRSGIYTGSTFYAHGNRACFWLFSTRLLLLYVDSKKPCIEESHGTIRKFYMPVLTADKWCFANFKQGERII